MKLVNYLFFRSGCEQALEFYTECGLGRVVAMVRHGDYGPPHAESMRGKVLHSEFAGPGVHFFASDNHDAEPMRGSAHFLMLETRSELDTLFAVSLTFFIILWAEPRTPSVPLMTLGATLRIRMPSSSRSAKR